MKMTKKLNSLSVFFPLYNEEKNIKLLVKEAMEQIPLIAKDYEIILVNDGSIDGTQKVAEELATKNKCLRVINQENKGYGGALQTGFREAKKEWVFFSDGDLQFNLSELASFIEHTATNDLIIGYRKTRADGFKRLLITWLLKIWNRFFFDFPPNIRDIDCAFKLIKGKSLKKISPLVLDGGLVSTELLLRAYRAGLRVKQLPVTHKSRLFGQSSGDSAGVIMKAVRETITLLNVFPDRKEFIGLIISWGLIALLLLPVALQINYMQNDEYTHYRLVEQFLKYDLRLDPYIGATFYVQGFVATLFAFIFGSEAIPVLTLLFSVGTAFIVSVILHKFFNFRFLLAISSGLLVFTSPLFLYSTWGFMSENYFMFFFVASLYFYFNFIKNSKSFLSANILAFLSYGVRQFGLFLPFAASLALLYKKRYKWAFIQFFVSLFFLLYHFKIFPQTPQMYDSRLNFSNFRDFDGILTRVYIFGIYIALFLAPFVVSFIYSVVKKDPKKLLLLLLVPLLFIVVEKKFEPETIIFTARTREGLYTKESIAIEFPYLGNIFTRKGFYEDNLPGDKYNFPGYFDLFNAMGVFGKWLFLSLIVYGISSFKNLNKLALFYSLVFIGVLCVSPKVFDRYLLPLIVTGLFLLAPLVKPTKFTYVVTLSALVFWFFLGYQFTADSIYVNKYIWSQAEKISVENDVSKNKISADHSWRQLYPNTSKNRIYTFTYKNFGESERSSNYSLVSTHTIKYPLSFYKTPIVYLYFNSGAVIDK